MTRPTRPIRSIRPAATLAAGAALATAAAVGTAPTAGAAAPAAPALQPSMTVSLSPTVSGRTLTYRYAESGLQHLVRQGKGAPYANRESTGYTVELDGQTIDGGNGAGGATCTTTGRLAPFSGRAQYAVDRVLTPGTHRLRVTGYYCGVGGEQAVTRTYVVTAKATNPAPSRVARLTAAGAFTAGVPLRLTATCAGAKTTTATVAGPRAMRARLTGPAGGALTGAITVPKALVGSWVRFNATCADGSHATTVIHRAR